MKKYNETYLTYRFPGIMFDETSSEKVESRDIEDAQKNAPKHSYCFEFYDIPCVEDEDDGEVYRKSSINPSTRYYIGGTILNLEEVKMLHPDKDVLISNMEINEYDSVIFTRLGNAQPWKDEYVLLEDANE